MRKEDNTTIISRKKKGSKYKVSATCYQLFVKKDIEIGIRNRIAHHRLKLKSASGVIRPSNIY